MGGGYEGYPTDPGEFWAVSHVFFGLFTMYLDTISWIRGDETIALAHSCKISIVCMGRGMMGTPWITVSSASSPMFFGLFTMRLDTVSWIQEDERIALTRSCAMSILCFGRGYQRYPMDCGEFWFISHGLWLVYNTFGYRFKDPERQEHYAQHR
jgi:hypothetical protein